MSQSEFEKSMITSPSHYYFQTMFEAADLYSAMWQPWLKSIGRWQLEVSGLGLKQGQAAIAWSHDILRSWTPGDAAAANMRYLEAVSTQVAETSQRLAANVSRAVEAPALSGVVPLPVKRGHDMIMLPEAPEERAEPRKVA
jgi:hypothetical protein